MEDILDSEQWYNDGWEYTVICPGNGLVTFEFVPGERRLSIKHGEGIGINPRNFPMRILQILLENAGNPVKLNSSLAWGSEEEFNKIDPVTFGQGNHYTNIRDKFQEVIALNGYRVPNDNKWALGQKRGGKYLLQGESSRRKYLALQSTAPENHPEWKKNYEEMRAAIKQTEKNIDVLISQLLDIYPEQLSGFFHETPSGTHLPFYSLAADGLAGPAFPLQVGPDASAPLTANRGTDSLFKQRKAEGAKLNNGQIYRLHKIENDSWTLGRTNYFNILDSCDYLRDRIFAGWGLYLLTEPSPARRTQAQQTFLRESALIHEWLDRVTEIRRGDFSNYHAGIAFNVPLFSSHEGTVHLVMAKGAREKAAGGGKYHVCPAGMFEYFRETRSDIVHWPDFQKYMAKELIEETMNNHSKVEEWLAKDLHGEWIDWDDPALQGDAEALDVAEAGELIGLPKLGYYIDKVRHEARCFGANGEPLNAVMDMSQVQFDPICIVDCFRLRPEIIQPLHLSCRPEVATNWEYEGTFPDFAVFEDRAGLLQAVEDNCKIWAEPGLAAMLIGGARIFDELEDDAAASPNYA